MLFVQPTHKFLHKDYRRSIPLREQAHNILLHSFLHNHPAPFKMEQKRVG